MLGRLILSVSLLLVASVAMGQDALQKKAERIAKKYPIVDTHIDVPYRLQEKWEDVTVATAAGDFDYPRAVAGGLSAPFMSIYIPASYEDAGTAYDLANILIDFVEALAGRAPDKFEMAYSSSDIMRQFRRKRISLVMGMENGAPIRGELDNVQFFYDRGIRYITLTHSKSNHISDSSYDINRQWGGLSPFGKELIPEMNKVGIMIDVSHVSDDAMYQAIEISEVPVIASHSSARHYTPDWERNMNDDMIKALADDGGVIQINFGSTFISQKSRDSYNALSEATASFMETNEISDSNDPAVQEFQDKFRAQNPFQFASLDDVLDNFDHVVKLVGVDHVGIGSDYDGVGDSLPTDLKDVSTYPNLIRGLLQRGYSEKDIKKILYQNTLRVWKAAEEYAAAH